MKIEHFLYGMFNGKIHLFKSPGVNKLLSDKNFQYLRKLNIKDSDHYLWLPTEQIIALPHIEEVSDKDGREWVINHTLLIHIHDYIRLTNPLKHLSQFFFKSPDLPETLESITIKS